MLVYYTASWPDRFQLQGFVASLAFRLLGFSVSFVPCLLGFFFFTGFLASLRDSHIFVSWFGRPASGTMITSTPASVNTNYDCWFSSTLFNPARAYVFPSSSKFCKRRFGLRAHPPPPFWNLTHTPGQILSMSKKLHVLILVQAFQRKSLLTLFLICP